MIAMGGGIIDSQSCQHGGCLNQSHTGFWCQECIEFEWPQAVVGDGQHWIGWKATWQKGNLFIGAFGAPYKIGEYTIPFACGDWLLSPLGALKEVYQGSNTVIWQENNRSDIHIISAIVRIREVYLKGNQVLRGPSPALTIAAHPLKSFPLRPEQATLLLGQMERERAYRQRVDELEKELRPSLPEKVNLPPAIPGPKSSLGDRLLRRRILREIWRETLRENTLSGLLGYFYSPINLGFVTKALSAENLDRIRERTIEVVTKHLGKS